jgi:branched-chain amino acid transport system substrate-binding protein
MILRWYPPSLRHVGFAVWRNDAVLEIHEHEKKCRNYLSHPVRPSLGIRRISVDHGLGAKLPGRVPRLCEVPIEHHRNGKIGVLFQNDDYGKDYLQGLKDGLGGKIPIVSEQSYETTDTTVTSQIISLKGTGADIFVNVTLPKFAAQAIARVAELSWHPVHVLNSVSNSVAAVLKPAGFENAVLTTAFLKDPTDPIWKSDPSFVEWSAFMEKYFPDGDRASAFTVYGYSAAQNLVQVLRQCGDDLTARM